METWKIVALVILAIFALYELCENFYISRLFKKYTNPPTEETMAEKTITITKAQAAQMFDEWANEYKANPGGFLDFFDNDQQPTPGYGEACANELFKRHAELVE